MVMAAMVVTVGLFALAHRQFRHLGGRLCFVVVMYETFQKRNAWVSVLLVSDS